MLITAVEQTKKGNYALFIEGEFVFSITPEQMYEDKIKAGMELSESKLLAVKRKSQEIFAREKAINLLARRSYTRKLLFKKLNEYVDDDIALKIVDRMEELDLINDEQYAKDRASDMYNLKNYGKMRVVRDLIERGIQKDIAERVADELEPDDKKDVIYDVIDKKYYRQFEKIETREDFYKAKQKVQNALARMGYSFDDIYEAVNSYVEKNDIKKYYEDNY